MDEYRQSLLGRALADVLQELEASSDMDPRVGDTLFSLFDDAIQEEFQQQQQHKSAQQEKQQRGAPDETIAPLFTHETMELRGAVTSYNRFMEKWSIHATVADDGLQLDHALVDLHAPAPPRSALLVAPRTRSSSVEMLVKLHHAPLRPNAADGTRHL